jgi:hypothetical protein
MEQGGLVRMPVKKLFLSWSRTDKAAKDALVGPLLDHLKILSGVGVEWWEDSHLRIGVEWRRELLARLDECDYGVLLVSPAFLGGTFILEEELPRFVGEGAAKGALPVALKRVPLDGSRMLSGVGDHQIFRDAEGRCFTETRGAVRERFVLDLATAIRERIVSEA